MNQLTYKSCPVCDSKKLHYAFSLEEHRLVRCDDCGYMLINPQPSDEVLASIYGGDYFVLSNTMEGRSHVQELKKSTANRYLDILLESEVGDFGEKTLLEIGCGGGDFLTQAALRGLKTVGVEYSSHACSSARSQLTGYESEIIQGEILSLDKAENYGRFDFVVFCDVLEHVRDPKVFLKIVHKILKPEGKILCIVPSLDSASAKFLKTNWMEFKLEHLHYFDKKTLRSMLFQENFSEMYFFPAKKTLSLDYIAAHFEKHRIPFWSKIVKILHSLVPGKIGRAPLQVTASGIGVMAKKKSSDSKLTLSVIMPAYNEALTIQNGIERVLNKKLEDVDIELILVESNSTDGTREKVKAYEKHPNVKVIFEPSPRGKGHAVRAGLKLASGDFILIQDADDEYDIDDYDVLIESLRDGREAFVLGARHGGGSWKMRQFSDQPVRAFVLNIGHWVFTFLVNIFCGVWLRDPFTMYKVFRRDSIKGLTFVANRFDFDYEILIKLIRSDCIPLEIPVNYRSRSFAQGKKVRMISDPINWIVAILKFRFVKI